MKRSLKAGLILASAFLLVACGSNEQEVTEQSTDPEVVEVEDTGVDVEETEVEGGKEELEGEDPEPAYTILKTDAEDGSTGYTLQGEEDERGWAVIHSIVVDAEGKIIESDFNYINSEGKYKTDDAEYVAQMLEVAGNDITKTIDYLNKYLVENQGLGGITDASVDVVSGATGTYTAFTDTANELLAQLEQD